MAKQAYFNSGVIRATPRLDMIAQWLMMTLLVFMPLALGVVHAWSELVVLCVTAILAAMLIVRAAFTRAMAFRWTWAYLPGIVLLFVGLMQLVPLPQDFIEVVSPHSIELKKSLLKDIGTPDIGSISFYRYGTWHSLRVGLMVAVTFVVVFNVFDTPHRIRWLMRVVGLIGGAIAIVALAQSEFGNNRILWSLTSSVDTRSGPFVNRNNFGQFMLLSMGAAIGAVLAEIQSHTIHTETGRQRVRWTIISPDRQRLILVLASAVVFQCVAMARAGSRGSMGAMVLAGGLMIAAVYASKRYRRWAGITFAASAFIVMGAVLLAFDFFYTRLEELEGPNAHARLTIAADLWRVFLDFPVTGVGMGTHETFYPAYQTLETTKVAIHADSDYPQILAETGVLGMVSLVLLGCIVARAWIGAIRHSRQPIAAALFGLGFALVAVLIQSAVDFGQRLPANGCVTAVVVALVLSIARLPRKTGGGHGLVAASNTGRTRMWFHYSGVLGMLLLAIVLNMITIPQAIASYKSERHWQIVQKIEQRLKGDLKAPPQVYTRLLAEATQAVRLSPHNAQYRYVLNAYRWHTLQLAATAEQGRPMPQHRREQIDLILSDLRRVRTDCPTHGPATALEGAIRLAIGQSQHGIALINRAERLHPYETRICFLLASVEAKSGREDRVLELMQRAVSLEPKLYESALKFLVNQLQMPKLALKLADGDHRRLFALASRISEAYPEIGQRAWQRGAELLGAKCERDECEAGELAIYALIQSRRGNVNGAIETYGRAIDLDYGNVPWRVARARLLVSIGRVEDAERDMKACLRLQKTNREVRKLLDQIATMPKGDASSQATP